MKLRTLVTAAGLLALLSASAHAQAYRPTFSTQIKLAGNTTDPRDTITIKAPSLLATDGGASWTMTLPNTAGVAGYVMATDGFGNLHWVSATASGTEWNILGNAATSPLTNFIGTTDATDFVLRTNNTERMRVKSGGNLNVSAFGTAGVVHNLTGGDLASSLLVDADVSGTAAIAGTKVVPHFGPQSVVTGDGTTSGAISIFDMNNHAATIFATPNLGAWRDDTLPAKSGTFAMLSDLTNGGNINVFFDTLSLASLTTGGVVQSATGTGTLSNGDLSGDVGTVHATLQDTISALAGNHVIRALNNGATTSPINVPVTLAATGLSTSGTLGVTGAATFGASPATKGSLSLYDASNHTATIWTNTALTTARNDTLPDKSGTFAMLSDLTNGSSLNVSFDTLTLGSLAHGGLVQSQAGTGLVSNGDLSGDVTTSGSLAATISTTTAAGNNIVGALNSPATAKSLNADVLNYDATLQVTSHALGFNLTHANAWAPSSGVNTFTGASGQNILELKAFGGSNEFVLASGGALTLPAYSTGVLHSASSGAISSSTIFNADVDPLAGIAGTKIAANFGNQTVTTGDATHAGHFAIYDANGHVATIQTAANLTGAQTDTLPAKSGTFAMLSDLTGGSGTGNFATLAVGSLSTGGLVQSSSPTGTVSNGDLFGDVITIHGTLQDTIAATAGAHVVAAVNTSGAAASMNGSVLKYDSTLQVNGGNQKVGVNLAQTNVWTGMQTFGAMGLTQNGTVNFSGDLVTLQVNPNYSYFFMANASSVTGNVNGLGFTSGTPTAGRMIILVNSGTNPITFVHMSGSAAPGTQFDMGGNVIVDASGSVTLLYDGAAWHMLSAQ